MTLTTIISSLFVAALLPWQNPAVNEINRYPMHTTFDAHEHIQIISQIMRIIARKKKERKTSIRQTLPKSCKQKTKLLYLYHK